PAELRGPTVTSLAPSTHGDPFEPHASRAPAPRTSEAVPEGHSGSSGPLCRGTVERRDAGEHAAGGVDTGIAIGGDVDVEDRLSVAAGIIAFGGRDNAGPVRADHDDAVFVAHRVGSIDHPGAHARDGRTVESAGEHRGQPHSVTDPLIAAASRLGEGLIVTEHAESDG